MVLTLRLKRAQRHRIFRTRSMLGTATMYHILQEVEEAKFNSGNNPIRCLGLPSKTVQTAMPCLAYRNTLFSSPILSDFDAWADAENDLSSLLPRNALKLAILPGSCTLCSSVVTAYYYS